MVNFLGLMNAFVEKQRVFLFILFSLLLPINLVAEGVTPIGRCYKQNDVEEKILSLPKNEESKLKQSNVSERISSAVQELKTKESTLIEKDSPEEFSLDAQSQSVINPLSEQIITNPIKLDISQKEVFNLNLEKALTLALENNLFQSRLVQFRKLDAWSLASSASNLLPTLFFSNSAIFRDGQQFISPQTGVPIANRQSYITQYGIRGSLGLPLGFSTVASYYDWLSSSAEVKSGSQKLLQLTANQYYELVRARAELKVREISLNLAKSQLELTRELKDGGVGTKFMEIQSSQQLKEFEIEHLNQQSMARIAEIQLLATLNLPLNLELKLDDAQIGIKRIVDDSEAEDFAEQALKNRPSISEKALNYRAAQYRLRQAVSGLLPNVYYSATSIGNKTSFGKSWELGRQDDFQNAVVGLDWQLSGLGLGQASEIGKRVAEKKISLIDLKQERLDALKEIREAYVAKEANKEQIKVSEEQLKSASDGIVLAKIRLRSGIGTNLDVIESQKNYVNALINKVRSITRYNQSQVDLLRSAGNISVNSLVNPD